MSTVTINSNDSLEKIPGLLFPFGNGKVTSKITMANRVLEINEHYLTHSCKRFLTYKSVNHLVVLSRNAAYHTVQGDQILSPWMKSYSVTIQVKASEQYFITSHYFLVVLFIMLYEVVLTFESVDENIKYDR